MNQSYSYRLTDKGNVEALISKYGSKIRFCPLTNRWFIWNDQVWDSSLGDSPLYPMIFETLRTRRLSIAGQDSEVSKKVDRHLKGSENFRKLRDAVGVAAKMPELRRTSLEFDQSPWKIGLLDGELDLATQKWNPPNPASFLTMQAGVSYSPGADAPRWIRFLSEIFQGDELLMRWVQKAIGYCLTGDVREQVMFICVGEGANGKSTFLEVIKNLLGNYSATASFNTFSALSRNDQTNDLARLKGKRLVTIIESEEDAYLAESKVKTVTGDEAISCRFLFREFFEYVPQFKVWMAVNREPQIRGTDHGIKRRVLIIRFDRRFEGNSRVDNLKEELLKELPGVLNWALEGLRMWREEGLRSDLPVAISEANTRYVEEMDTMGQWLNECVEVVEPERFERANDLYQSYSVWMKLAGLKPKGRTQWGKDMRIKEVGIKKRDKHGERYMGLSLVYDLGLPQPDKTPVMLQIPGILPQVKELHIREDN